MAFDGTVYDWPASIVPAYSMFRAGGQGTDGGFTTGGVLSVFPEVGGRAALDASFNYFNGVSARMISWATSKVMNGSVFRVRLWRSPQLVSAIDMGLSPLLEDGIPWDNDGPWDNGQNWQFAPLALTSASSLKGSVSLTLDTTGLLRALQYGHVIGHQGRAYLVDDIVYSSDGNTATVTVSPPLRVAVEDGAAITFRPTMYCTVEDPQAFRSMFDSGGVIQPGNLVLREFLL